jgi:hypothetical protein
MTAGPARVPTANRRSCWTGTPEVYFTKNIDNSRVIRVDDPKRSREMRIFGIALACLCMLVLSYAWQHFKSVEYGYKIAELKSQRDGLIDVNRALRLETASLREPGRIDAIAKKLGLVSPEPGQVLRLDVVMPDGGAPVMASATPVSLVTVR